MESEDIVIALTALAQASRLAVFRLLVQTGEEGMPAGKIAEALDIPPSSLSFHLKELHYAGLIKPRQDGRFVIYSANYDRMKSVLGYLTENCCNGKSC
jgi:ArsR family transcriptional regulator